MDEDTFFTKAKSTVYDILDQNRNMKIKLKLCCKLARTDMSTGEVSDVAAMFWSSTHVNYPAADLKP